MLFALLSGLFLFCKTILAIFKRRYTESPIVVVSEGLAYMQYLDHK